MNALKGSVVYKMTNALNLYSNNSGILSGFKRYRKTSRVLGWFTKHKEKENDWLNGSVLFRENDIDMIKVISKKEKTISETITIPFIANSYVVNLLLTFLECEADDRDS